MSLWSRLRVHLSRSKPADPLIRLRERGFEIVGMPDGEIKASVAWRDIVRIQAYKLDLVTTDCICLLFEFGEDRAPVQVSEEWPGFVDLFGPLVERFPTISESWYLDIMTPAFEAKRTVLFDSSGQGRVAVD